MAEHRQNSETASESLPVAAAVDPIEAALAAGVAKASAAGEWSVVLQLAKELEARRVAREAAAPAVVIDLASRRKWSSVTPCVREVVASVA